MPERAVRRGLAFDAGLALAGFAVLALLPAVFPSKALVDFVIRLAAFGIFATSLNLLIGYGGMVSFGHGMFFASGAYAFGLLMQKAGTSIPVAVALAVLFSALLAGVVGAICAWNVPLFITCNKMGAALAAGCSVVLKPAPETPMTGNYVAQLFIEAGVPAEAISVVTGGTETGQALVAHPDVDKITFTGSTAAGKAIGAACAQTLKRCSLELGGKSAAIVLDDVDLAANAFMLTFLGLFNTGQACVAQTRILVPRSRQDEIVAAMVEAAKAMKVGLPSDPEAQLGPLITENQRNKVEEYVELGKKAGATAVLESERPAGLDSGYFLTPTIFTGVTNDMAIAQEEIFGPVLSVIAYDDVDEAIAIANDSSYGLAGTVWTNDVERGIEISTRIRTGTFGINWYAIDPESPFGGYKNSGIGRENGREGLESFLEHKSTMLPMGYEVSTG